MTKNQFCTFLLNGIELEMPKRKNTNIYRALVSCKSNTMYSCNNLNALHLQTLTDVLAHKMNIRNITKCTYFLAPNQLIGKYMYIIY